MKLQFDVTGMTCAACSARVEKVSRAVSGVNKADVNLLAGKLTVESDADVSAAIEQAVVDAGYGIAPAGKKKSIQTAPASAPSAITITATAKKKNKKR